MFGYFIGGPLDQVKRVVQRDISGKMPKSYVTFERLDPDVLHYPNEPSASEAVVYQHEYRGVKVRLPAIDEEVMIYLHYVDGRRQVEGRRKR